MSCAPAASAEAAVPAGGFRIRPRGSRRVGVPQCVVAPSRPSRCVCYKLASGKVTETYSGRWYDAAGNRQAQELRDEGGGRLRAGTGSCSSSRGAERRRGLRRRQPRAGRPQARPSPRSGSRGSLTRGSRLQRDTVKEYERVFRTRLEPRFGELPLGALKPRMVSQWRAELVADGVGPEAIRGAMTLLQAMYSVAIEWGEASTNPVSVVRKPRQGRRRAVTPDRARGCRTAAGRASTWRRPPLADARQRPGLRRAPPRRSARASSAATSASRTILVEQAVSDGDLKVQKTGRNSRTVDLLGPLASDLEAWLTPCGDR